MAANNNSNLNNDTLIVDIVVLDEPETDDTTTASKKSCCTKDALFSTLRSPKAWVGIFLIALLVYVIIDSFTTEYVKDTLTDFLDFIQGLGFGGAVLFAVVYVIATVLLIPGTILTLGAGFVFTQTNDGDQVAGTFIGASVVFVGASVGAILAFLFGRFLFKEAALGFTRQYKIFRAIDKAIETNGFKIVLLLRLSPAIPFNVLNYLLGTTSVSLRHYALACIGLIPGTTAFCFIGSTLSTLSSVSEGGDEEESSSTTVRTIVLIVGIIATIIAVVLITIYAKKELKKHLEGVEEDAEEETVREDAESTDYVSY